MNYFICKLIFFQVRTEPHVLQKQVSANVQLVGKDNSATDPAVIKCLVSFAKIDVLVKMVLLATHRMVRFFIFH